MKPTHILLTQIERRQVGNICIPEQFQYDSILGAWLAIGDKLLVEDRSFIGVASKKKDIETGEDQK
jgi:hypothetical protein